MRLTGPGFLKIFFCACVLFSCSPGEEDRGSYAETLFLPASASQMAELTDAEPVTLEGAQQKLLDELFAQEILEKTLAELARPADEIKKIKTMLSGEIAHGLVCLRMYSADKDFSVRFLQGWMKVYTTEKNRKIGMENRQKIKVLDKELMGIVDEQSRLKDSLTWVKDKYGLLVSPEEIAQALSANNYHPDSTGVMIYNLLQARFGKTFEHYARVKQKKDDLASDLLENSLSFYMVQQPRFIPVPKNGRRPKKI